MNANRKQALLRSALTALYCGKVEVAERAIWQIPSDERSKNVTHIASDLEKIRELLKWAIIDLHREIE